MPSRGPSVARTTSTTRTASTTHTVRTTRSARTAAAAVGCAAVLSLTAGSVSGGPVATSQVTAQNDQTGHQLEALDRGLVAVGTEDGVHLSWRLLGDEVSGATGHGMNGPNFHVLRDGERIATVNDSTNLHDPDGGADATYTVTPVGNAAHNGPDGEAEVWADGHYDLPLQKPEPGTTPAGEEYDYHANDVSVGDVTGDGQYEFVVKWDPRNSKDVSQVGYTGEVYVDTYTLDGELLNRIELGPNIRAGAHYTQFLVYDFDGDGTAEIMMKTAPGTVAGDGEHITMPQEDLDAGYSHSDDYRLSSEDYYEHVVDMFSSWHEHPEVTSGQWPETLEEAFGEEPEYDYPLSDDDARELADFFIDEYAPSRSDRNELRDFEGFILHGPEYLTVFDGESGAELDTVDYTPERGDDGMLWGDYAMSRIEPGNRVDRFLAGVAYLDGQAPSAVFSRGYYTRSAAAAYDFDGEQITERWTADSGHVPMDNPFDDSPHGAPGTDPELGDFAGQGFHSLSVADVDDDGNQEIIYGSATLDHDGGLLYSSTGTGHSDSPIAGEEAPLGHGDALHVGHFDPDREGQEVFSVHEGGEWAPYGYVMRDAASGEALWGGYTGEDTGRAMVGDIDPETPGYHVWASIPPNEDEGTVGLFTADGEPVDQEPPGTNMNIRWSADMTTQLVEGISTEDALETPWIEDVAEGTLLEAEGTATNNGTKGNPSLVADIFGDWREELVLRTEDSEALRIFSSTEVTDRKLYTLMHDPQYRVGVAYQQTAYNQPTYPDFYLGHQIDWRQVPVPQGHYPTAD